MAKITAIRSCSKGKARKQSDACEVEIDGRHWAKLDAETIVRQRLGVGVSLDAKREKEILLADEVLLARRAGAARAALKPCARSEMLPYLQRKGFGAAAIDLALENLQSSGAVDDEAVARRWIRRRRREGGYGADRIRDELQGMGLDPDMIERLLEEALKGTDPEAECRDFIAKKIERYRPLSDPRNFKRLRALLLRRGFDGETIASCLRNVK